MSFVNKYDKYDSVPLAYVEEMTTTRTAQKKIAKKSLRFSITVTCSFFLKIICYEEKKNTKPMFINLIFKYNKKILERIIRDLMKAIALLNVELLNNNKKLEFSFFFHFYFVEK